MKVQDLIEKLEEMPPNLKVVMSQDSEGNGYSDQIEVENDRNQCVALYPSAMYELDDLIDDYEYED